MQAGRFASPVNVIAAAVREINQPWLIDLYNSRSLVVESRIVLGDCGIMDCGLPQFLSRHDSTGNNRVGINHPAVVRLNRSKLKATKKLA